MINLSLSENSLSNPDFLNDNFFVSRDNGKMVLSMKNLMGLFCINTFYLGPTVSHLWLTSKLAEFDIANAGGLSLWRSFSVICHILTFFWIFDLEWLWISLLRTLLIEVYEIFIFRTKKLQKIKKNNDFFHFSASLELICPLSHIWKRMYFYIYRIR